MKRLLLAAALLAALITVGCCSEKPGSREFIPGKGWVPN